MRNRGDDDSANGFRRNTSICKGFRTCVGCHVDDVDIIGSPESLLDARALLNPFVRRVDGFDDFGIRNNAASSVHAESDDFAESTRGNLDGRHDS